MAMAGILLDLAGALLNRSVADWRLLGLQVHMLALAAIGYFTGLGFPRAAFLFGLMATTLVLLASLPDLSGRPGWGD